MGLILTHLRYLNPEALTQPKYRFWSHVRYRHMLDAAKAISQHVVDKKASDLEEDRLLLGGIIRELLLIGEAANAVSSMCKSEILEIPWKEVIGMRNQLIHGYFDISYKIVWSTATEDIPRLIVKLEKILHS